MTGRKKTDADLQIAQRIHVLRKQRNISQEHLAKALGISFQQVQKYERGTNRVSAGRLVDIAAALGVPTAALRGSLAEEAWRGRCIVNVFNLTAETLQLALAFQNIGDAAKRRQILALVRSVSES